ncbi:uncharacterized protein LOC133897690 [Phragmites australis]|uniref:uncharacterized protein LOC133897690 n=1 Tax=Phragmites australis TaxID=29695 RepID=UPI002D7692CA|nr:uncharacterized protein LOC133897690 [Phragmites australis]
MASLMQLWNDWQIQLLVVLSFMLQIFLFFSGSLRQRSNSGFLRVIIWLAYLGADMVAVYVLGQLSRHEDFATQCNGNDMFGGAHPLAFFWTPFLLVHLGGQDTVTAFSIDDNRLWLRHLLNLVIQVVLALYVFWKSKERNHLLVPAVFMFIAGIIKYGERTLALKSASPKGLRSSTSNKTSKLPELNFGDVSYSGIFSCALHTAPGVRDVFAGRTVSQMKRNSRQPFTLVGYGRYIQDVGNMKMLEIELGMMYDDVYTKAMVLRTWTGNILRLLAQISMVVALVFFIVSDHRRYGRADIVMTYALFIGGFCLEVCSIFMMMVSPWTWAFLKARRCHRLASVSWKFLSFVWPKKRSFWSNSMGQYNLLNSCMDDWSRPKVIAKAMNAIGIERLWSNFRHSKHVKADMEMIMAFVEQRHYPIELFLTIRGETEHLRRPNLGPALERTLTMPFEYAIIQLHVFTDLFLSLHSYDPDCGPPISADEVSSLRVACEKLSNYMLYLLVANPSMLPIAGDAEDALSEFSREIKVSPCNSKKDILDELAKPGNDPLVIHLLNYAESNLSFQETLVAIRDVWMRLLFYAAGKSRAEVHAEQLGKGGELLTFVWLWMSHYSLGDVGHAIDLYVPSGRPEEQMIEGSRYSAFDFRQT